MAVAVVIHSFNELLQLKDWVRLRREKRDVRNTQTEEKGTRCNLGSVGGCFAEIYDVDVDLHFLEFFGDLLQKSQCDVQPEMSKWEGTESAPGQAPQLRWR